MPAVVDEAFLKEPAELALHERLAQLTPLIDAHLKVRDYQASMRETAGLREPVDRFFDEVMVMDEDASLRANRLALLNLVNQLCCSTAELSLLTAPETPGGGTSDTARVAKIGGSADDNRS